ncbi:unnamed protein product [Pedinophyceae sp. YPF-701]|nr:unnamed protein product [Pedinophyceae sp. YPF-701]
MVTRPQAALCGRTCLRASHQLSARGEPPRGMRALARGRDALDTTRGGRDDVSRDRFAEHRAASPPPRPERTQAAANAAPDSFHGPKRLLDGLVCTVIAVAVAVSPVTAAGAPESPTEDPAGSLVATIAGILGRDSDAPDSDPIDPFTLFGTNTKQFLVEILDGDRVTAQRRGVTVRTCVSAVKASQETPAFQSLGTRQKVEAGSGLTCVQTQSTVEGDVEGTCQGSCGGACEGAIDAYIARYKGESGYTVDAAARKRILRACNKACYRNCKRGGRTFDFVVASRNLF